MKLFCLGLAASLGLVQQIPALTQGTIDSTVSAVASVIAAEYFDAAVTERISSTLTAGRAAGDFARAQTPSELAQRLNDVLHGVTRDKHLRVQLADPSPRTAGGGGAPNRRDQPTTAGFKRMEVLPGNIGLLEMTMFLRPAEHRTALAEAMKQLADADALIIDLRANGGGSPATVALLMSYLFDEPGLPLFDIIPRTGDTDSYRTEPDASDVRRNGRRPIFALTSARTFSGGEGFAYLMQERKRAVVIGERTAGAANPGRAYPVNELFQITIPNGQIRSAINHSNWEGGGVAPDIAVPAAQALDVAIEHARAVLKQR